MKNNVKEVHLVVKESKRMSWSSSGVPVLVARVCEVISLRGGCVSHLLSSGWYWRAMSTLSSHGGAQSTASSTAQRKKRSGGFGQRFCAWKAPTELPLLIFDSPKRTSIVSLVESVLLDTPQYRRYVQKFFDCWLGLVT